MKGSPAKAGMISGTPSHASALKLKAAENASALKQTTAKSDTTYTKGPTSVVTVTSSDQDGGNKTKYPVVRYLGDAEHKSVLNNLPSAVFKGGKNTGNHFDVDRDKYSRFLSRMGKTDGKK